MTAAAWPRYPFIYEINTWVWLAELSRASGRRVDLSCVGRHVWDAIADLGFNAVWLMGAWERSPAGTAIANRNRTLHADFERALPDFKPEDNVGSPYCVRRFEVDPRLGGPEGMAVARQELARRGIRLLLDFVPNHVAPDHAWVTEHPDFFIQGGSDDIREHPDWFIDLYGRMVALGRDPYFPPWPDVVQLNAFQADLRAAVIETIRDIAGQCDGVRCDMAMLALTAVFERTWGHLAGPRPTAEYWRQIIPAVRQSFPDFRFIAEAYWGTEWELQQHGFDFCYDKRLYDRLRNGSAEEVRQHLSADMAFQEKLIRFLENHDEPRAAAQFSPRKHEAAAVVISSLPGAKLFHQGQLEGRRMRLPVFLDRAPQEPLNRNLGSFYQKLLATVDRQSFRDGQWQLCRSSGWADNQSHRQLLAWCWAAEEERFLIVINFGDDPAQGRVHLPWKNLADKTWLLRDQLFDVTFERDGNEMAADGLYVDLAEWGFHFLQIQSSAPVAFQ